MKIRGVIVAKARKRKRSETFQRGYTATRSIHLFGCQKCSTMIIEIPAVEALTCPVCGVFLDVFACYQNICFAKAVEVQLPVSAVRIIKE